MTRLRLLFVGAIATALLIVGVFWLRAYQTTASDAKLCRKIDRLDALFYGYVTRSKPLKPGQYGYAYWKAHHESEPLGAPGGKPSPELVALLKSAACDPKNLPSNKGARP